MPLIEHSGIRMPAAVDNHRERTFVSGEQGAVSLTIKEVELHPGWEGRLHTHPTDIAIMVTAGAVQLILGDEVSTIRAGTTMFAPPRSTAQTGQPTVDPSSDVGNVSNHRPGNRLLGIESR